MVERSKVNTKLIHNLKSLNITIFRYELINATNS